MHCVQVTTCIIASKILTSLYHRYKNNDDNYIKSYECNLNLLVN